MNTEYVILTSDPGPPEPKTDFEIRNDIRTSTRLDYYDTAVDRMGISWMDDTELLDRALMDIPDALHFFKYEELYGVSTWLNAHDLGIFVAALWAGSESAYIFDMRDVLRCNLLMEILHGNLDAPL